MRSWLKESKTFAMRGNVVDPAAKECPYGLPTIPQAAVRCALCAPEPTAAGSQ